MYSFSNKRFSLSWSLLNRRKSFCSFQNNQPCFAFSQNSPVFDDAKAFSVCVALKKTKRNEREKNRRGREKKIDTLNKNGVEISLPCVLIKSLGRFLHISRSILFPNNVIVSIQQTRAGSTQNRHAFIIINNTTIERERERTRSVVSFKAAVCAYYFLCCCCRRRTRR